MAIALPANVPVATLQNYLRNEIIDPNMRHSALLEKAKARKCLAFNKKGLNACTWPVKFYRRDITEINGATTGIELPYVMSEDQANIPWASYRLGESIPKLVTLVNAPGATQIYSLMDGKLKTLSADFIEALRFRMWQDGSKTQAGMYGFLSMFGSSSTPSYYSPSSPIYNQVTQALSATVGGFSTLDTSRATSTAAGVTQPGVATATNTPWWACKPTATYAGIPTTLGARDSNWTGASNVGYPDGLFGPSFNYFSPLICDYNSPYFTPNAALYPSSPPHNWKGQWQQACNRLMLKLNEQRSTPAETIMLTSSMLADAEDSTIGQQRFTVGETGENVALGIKSLRYNGVEFMTEFGVPAGCGFAINWNKLHLWSLQGDLISNEKDNDIVTLEDLFSLDFYGQMWFDSPAFFGLLTGASYDGSTAAY